MLEFLLPWLTRSMTFKGVLFGNNQVPLFSWEAGYFSGFTL